MSKSPELLEIEKCIASRLWYTASAILATEIESHYLANYTRDDIEHFHQLIQETLISSENRLQYEWICHKLLLWLDKRNAAKTKEKLDLIQFNSNLNLISNEIPETVEKELLELFETIVRAKRGETLSTNKISSSSSQFLENSLNTNPTITCWLVNDLLHIWPTTCFSSDSDLQDLYSSALKLMIEKEKINEHSCALLCVLSKLNLTESKEDELITWLYPQLFNKCNSNHIELSLYSRKNIKFLKEWHKFVDNECCRSVPVDSIEIAHKISNVIFSKSSNNLNEPSFCAKQLTLRVIKRGAHWLLDILDMCSMLIKNREYDKTSRILSCPLLRPLWPSLLFHTLHNLPHIQITAEAETWQKNISIFESLEFLLNECCYSQYENNEPIPVNLNTCLSDQLNVIKWILDYRKKYLSTAIDQNFSIKRILNGLQNYDILTVLKKSIDIHQCDFNEVENLLKDKVETMRVFKCYRAMQTALKAILASEAYNARTKDIATNHFTELEFLINTITPLYLRLEVIENVFSMLFLRHDVHFNTSEGTSEEEDYETTFSERDKYSSAHENRESETPNRYGFICNKYSVKKLLHHLSKCLVQVGIDFAKLRRGGNTNDLETLQKRIYVMDNALADSFWRLELLTSSEFINSKDDAPEYNTILSNDSDAIIDEKLSYSSRLKSKAIFYNQQNESSSEEGEKEHKSDMEVSSETGSNDTNLNNRRRKRSKIMIPSIGADGTAIKNSNSKFIVNLMLASKESLTLQCLWKGDYVRAQQVIEMFNMKNTPLDGQVRFSKAVQSFRNDMTSQMNFSDITDSSMKNKELQTLENIRRAVQGGYQSSRVTSQLETFTASQQANAQLFSTKSLGTREILMFCVLDLALTMGQSPQNSTSLLDVAIKYLKFSRNGTLQDSNPRHSAHFNEVYQLIHEGNLAKSVPGMLCDASVPLKLQEWREKTDFWQRLTESTKQFQDTQSLLDKLDNKISDGGPTLSGEKVFREIIALCGNGQSYLHKVLAHLQILQSIVPNDEQIVARTESVLLSNSLDSYFGHQIFDLHIEPQSLEITANKLGVNLVHNILVNCCPKLTCYDSSSTISSDSWGCIILNKTLNSNVATDHKSEDPNQCVIDILLELLEAIQRFYPDCARILNKDLNDLSKDSEIKRILDKTSVLETLDLSELSVGEHTLAFFLNLWNLLFLHALLTVWVFDPPLNSLRSFISLSSINYQVGDLGRISLINLRFKLLGCMSWDSDFFSRIEDLNEVAWQDLDLPHDPRIIFAMANEFYETPAIRIYYPQTLNKDLNQGFRDYLDYYLIKELDSNTINSKNSKYTQEIVRLPELVERYEKYVEKNVSNLDYNNVAHNQTCQSIFSVHNYFNKSEKMIRKYEPVVSFFEVLINYKEIGSAKNDSTMKRSTISYSSAWVSRSVKSNVLHYLEGHCWLLSYLVKRLHKEGSSMLESGCDNLQRTACFENISTSPWILTLAAALFDDNPTLATIQENLSLNDLWIYLEKCMKDDRIQDCLDIVNALPSKLLIKCTEIQCLKDKLLYQLIYKMEDHSDTEKILQYIYQIKDINVLAQTILFNISKWPVHLCQDALFHALHHKDKCKLPSHCRFKLSETLCRVTVFYKMLPYCKNKELNSKEATWYDVIYCTEKTDPMCIIQSLLEADKFELCLEWLEYQSFSLEIQSSVTQELLIGLLKSDEVDFKNAEKLLSALPTRQSLKMCKGVLKRLNSIRAMRFIIDYLLEHCEPLKKVGYHKAQIGVEILNQLEPKERIHYIQLIKEPLLMLEQLLMNCKFENLRRILDVIQKLDNLQDVDFSMENFDKIVRFYAGKSLDFRVSLQRDGIDSKSKDSSAPSLSDNEVRNGEFIMPINVPTKEEWIPNDKVRECSCCKAVIFSMFNRRHHCRRCGRVVCAACSQHRMQVMGYPKSVLVRVCDDCKRQTVLQMQVAQGPSSTASSIALECWKLTIDETHNQTVREEFSFEYAPNISLCLAILTLHSDHQAYASFLLDRCDEMKRLLHPGSGGRVNPEIDHALIIKMIRSLLVAVKVKCAKLGLNAGLAHCDRFLSQVDLIATLVQSDCLALIPTDDSLDEHALRKLRDLLTEKEQWTLALDVSTKSGLDTQGVWAAWGKASLKVGFLERARAKFSHCMEKVLYENFDDWVLVTYSDTEGSNKSSDDALDIPKQRKLEDTKHESPCRKRKNRPLKDPPLLLEILQILENQNQLNPEQTQSANHPKQNVAQEIVNTVNSLKAISQGQCSLVHSWSIRNIYYEESLYYLLSYGSTASILEFFVKYEEFNKCLAFVLENNVEPDVFFNAVYMRCLNMGNVEKLFSAIRADDTSLLTWKKYLVYTCHCLDKKQFLNTLYHLQLFMRDYIRAAMTCIHFYKNESRDYIDLCSKSHFLVNAQKHLETELNVENLSKKRRKSISSSHSGTHGGLTMEMEPSEIDKHINTISRQLEIAKFLSKAEKEGRPIGPYLKHLLDMDTENAHSEELPTLFGNQQQKTRLAVLAILCGRDAEEGFGTAFRIMQDYNLRAQKVYSLAGHVLALEKKIGSIEQLIKCCRSSGAPDSQCISDRVLTHCVKLLLQNTQKDPNLDFKDRVDSLIRLISDVELKISAYIESKQLKSAYLLAVRHQRAQDIRRILKEADRLGQNPVRALCTKWLKQTQNSL